VAIILNKRISNPHMRVEFIRFLHHLMPQKKPQQGRERQNQLYKNVFFENDALKAYLMHACIQAFYDSEKTGFYTKYGLRHAAASLMEYLW
jgi:hypothetical protein